MSEMNSMNIFLFYILQCSEVQNSSPVIYKPQRVLTLSPSGVAFGSVHCTDLAWYRGPGHKVVAAAFSSGHIGLFNLATKSPLLRKSPDQILPYMYFRYNLLSIKLRFNRENGLDI